MPHRSAARRALAVAVALLVLAGCSREIAGNVTTSNPDVPLSPTVGEGPGAAYAVLSCRDIGREEAALAGLAAPTDSALQQQSAALQALGKAKGCSSLTGQLTDTPAIRHQ